jgi:endonuclease YncB( thermonuclease family)
MKKLRILAKPNVNNRRQGSKTLPAINRFNKLIDDISLFVDKVQASKVRFDRDLKHSSEEIGRLLVEVEQEGEVRAAYGTHLLEKVSKVLIRKYGKGFSVTNLKYMRRFYLSKKSQHADFLPWSKNVELLSIKDLKVRRELTRQAVKEGLNRNELRALISGHRSKMKTIDVEPAVDKPAKPLPPLVRPTDLKLHTYAKYNRDEIDCGFYLSYPVAKADLKDVIITKTPLYTYTARVERVVDGDTLCVGIDVGFGMKLHEKLRLRGINTPELNTAAGKRAKRYVRKLLPVGARIVIKSRKIIIDNHGRFVMDVFYLKPRSTAHEIITGGTYLNQHLLDTGHAVRMAE